MEKSEKLHLKLLQESQRVEPECQSFPDIFFPEDWGKGRDKGENYFQAVRTAKVYCGRCPIRQLCLDYAITANENFGVWGGMSPAERRAIRRASRYREALQTKKED
jgi:WhiB family redox-sensing transcriptional regulator